MRFSPLMENLAIGIGCAIAGAIAAAVIGAIPRAWRGFKKDIGDEALHRDAELKMAKELGTQSQRITDLAGDLHGVAEMVRKRFEEADKKLDRRFEKLKMKDTALETLLTGELPRITDETEAIDG